MRPIRVTIVADPDPAFVDLVRSDGRFDLEIRPCRDESDLLAAVTESDVIVSRSSTKLTRSVIEAAVRLRVLAQGTTGVDNIDLSAAERKGVTVVTTPGANADAVAEAVLGAMITLQRNLAGFTREMLQGTWDRENCATRSELASCIVGIVGVGRVGTRVARLLSFLEHLPLGFDPYVDRDELRRRGVEPVESLQELLTRSSVVTLHVPLTEETRGMIGRAEIEAMPAPRIVINTSRGEVADPEVIRAAIEERRLAGAWIDVFPDEPADTSDWPDGNLILSPHAAGCSLEARGSASRRLYEGVCEALGLATRS